jgi:hypothetical protein
MTGWKSTYYNHVGTFGMGPEALAEYFKQNKFILPSLKIIILCHQK